VSQVISFITMKYETYRYFKEYCFLQTGVTNSLEKSGKKDVS